ncbi:hypothetical protein HK097_007592 [Rhizophlyctis rosea]|uniref:Uncharacterized protein n=1 Tax=Rhizophlyctis rosea TaxID=64517 RepID=A0AAD5X6P0_9FUNG|nr:hypothetical protein HK097_007592 [Rhizophlyctis rosea]
MPRERYTALILDFDETITSSDTIFVIAETAYNCRSSTNSPTNNIPSWSFFQKTYFSEWSDHKPPSPPPTPSLTSLRTHIQSYREVEQTSLTRVQKAGALAGGDRASLFEAGRRIETRLGWADAVKQFVALNGGKESSASVKIVSLNWSKDLIMGVVNAAGLADVIKKENIISNDLEFSADGKSTGNILGGILTGVDKADHMGFAESGGASICIGDR